MKIVIDKAHDSWSVKEYLYREMSLSTASVKRIKYRDGGITVDGAPVTVRHILREGETLDLAVEDRLEDENKYTLPANIPIEIIYEDDAVIVVNKPPSMPAHPSLGHKLDTVANALAYRYGDKPFVFRPVNRLDRDTSGLMLVARDKISAYNLYLSMRRGEIKKTYLALLDGVIDPSCGRIETYICREGESIVKRRVCDECAPGAKIAITDYETVSVSCGRTLVRAVPVTGRTHQLRVHFASVGCPITGDSMYGNASPLINRQALHAATLSFPHPSTGERITFEAPLPDDIANII